MGVNYADAPSMVGLCVQSILVQVRAEIMSDPKAQLDPSQTDQEYSESEAKMAFERMVQKYGWNR